MKPPLSLKELRDRVRQGEQFTYRLFYGHTPRGDGRLSNAVFSQFFARPFELGGQTYQWAEQWMMACKAGLFGDDDARRRILDATTAQACKQIGRQVENFDDIYWSRVRYAVVLTGTLAKFRDNPDLFQFLVNTGDEIIVEAAANDPIWGIGLDRTDQAVYDPMQWKGQNLLGFALVHARAVLKNQLPEPEPFELENC